MSGNESRPSSLEEAGVVQKFKTKVTLPASIRVDITSNREGTTHSKEATAKAPITSSKWGTTKATINSRAIPCRAAWEVWECKATWVWECKVTI